MKTRKTKRSKIGKRRRVLKSFPSSLSSFLWPQLNILSFPTRFIHASIIFLTLFFSSYIPLGCLLKEMNKSKSSLYEQILAIKISLPTLRRTFTAGLPRLLSRKRSVETEILYSLSQTGRHHSPEYSRQPT